MATESLVTKEKEPEWIDYTNEWNDMRKDFNTKRDKMNDIADKKEEYFLRQADIDAGYKIDKNINTASDEDFDEKYRRENEATDKLHTFMNTDKSTIEFDKAVKEKTTLETKMRKQAIDKNNWEKFGTLDKKKIEELELIQLQDKLDKEEFDRNAKIYEEENNTKEDYIKKGMTEKSAERKVSKNKERVDLRAENAESDAFNKFALSKSFTDPRKVNADIENIMNTQGVSKKDALSIYNSRDRGPSVREQFESQYKPQSSAVSAALLPKIEESYSKTAPQEKVNQEFEKARLAILAEGNRIAKENGEDLKSIKNSSEKTSNNKLTILAGTKNQSGSNVPRVVVNQK